jgi:hypothetical protein
LEGIGLENVYIFYGHMEYFTDIWDISWPFGTFCVHLVHFIRFWYHVPRKTWQPWTEQYFVLAAVEGHKNSVTRLGQIFLSFDKKLYRNLSKNRKILVHLFLFLVHRYQGDQMRMRNSRPKYCPIHFCDT